MRYYLSVDIGASSGRHIVGWKENGRIQTKEVYRFPNGVLEQNGHLVWDVEALVRHVKQGVAAAKTQFPRIESLSIDTWGVDYVLLKGEEEVLPVYAYRDCRTEAVIPQVHERMPFDELYRHTGCQFQPFNTIYQLYDEKINGRLEGVTDLLLMPEYLMYKLCGVKAREYTNATTMGMINAQTGEFDMEIVEALGYPKHLFPKLSQPGTVIGEYEGIKVLLCATHDTGSAVEGIPMEGNHPYISSGTWSLLGVKTPKPITDADSMEANYSNEGGVGYNRYQKNIMGMWLVNELQRELCPDMGFPELVKLAEESTCEALVDANASEFFSPKSMKVQMSEGDVYTFGNITMKVYDAPGHTPGTMAYFFEMPNGMIVGMHGGVGFNTLTSEYAKKHNLGNSWREAYGNTIQKLRAFRTDVVLGNHPSQNQTFAKQEAMTAECNPFVDPDGWNKFLDWVEGKYLQVLESDPL